MRAPGADKRVLRSGCQREQHALLAEVIGHRLGTTPRHDQPASRAAEQAAHGAEAIRAWHEHVVADAMTGCGTGPRDGAHGLVARNQRIAKARETAACGRTTAVARCPC